MANALGYITQTETGFEGTLSLMSLNTPIRIVPNDEKSAETQPHYRVVAGPANADIGAGWVKTSKRTGKQFISLSLADPQIGPRRVYCTITPVNGSGNRHVILWNPQG